MDSKTKAPGAEEASLDLDALVISAKNQPKSSSSSQRQPGSSRAPPSSSFSSRRKRLLETSHQHSSSLRYNAAVQRNSRATVNRTPTHAPSSRRPAAMDPQTVYLSQKDKIVSATKDKTVYLSQNDNAASPRKDKTVYLSAKDKTPSQEPQTGTSLSTKFVRATTYKGSHMPLYPSNTAAPSYIKSILHTPQDIRMASRQTRFNTLSPSDRAEQESWAQSVIKRSKACPSGFAWKRVERGYICDAGHHGITDELLGEGKGGIMLIPSGEETGKWYGPYYDHGERFRYCGPEPLPHEAIESFKIDDDDDDHDVKKSTVGGTSELRSTSGTSKFRSAASGASALRSVASSSAATSRAKSNADWLQSAYEDIQRSKKSGGL